MTSFFASNKRIAKNTLMLYIRMLFILLISLYTSRVILKSLGIVDYGIYNVVGGVIAMLGFINNSLSGATSRFLTYELGKNDSKMLHKIFRCSLSIHYLLAFFLFIIAETIGFWFVSEILVIQPERMSAALWVYQCSILTMLIMVVSAPYNALIIAHERMSAFAFISIFDVIAKLLIVLLLTKMYFDRLIVYSVLLVIEQMVIRFIYLIYCSRHFAETNCRWLWDKDISFKMLKYAGWTMNGNLAVVGYTQGINILLNLFFGPVVNAARGIAVQVQAAVNQFFSSFQMAVRPQLIKSYAQEDFITMHRLLIYSSKYSFYLMLLVAFPILVNMGYILQLWLEEVPPHTVVFSQLMLLACMNYALSNPTLMAIHATGDLKKFQIVEGTLLLTIIPVAWFSLEFIHVSPETVFVIYLVIETITQFIRVWIVYPRIQLSRRVYLEQILWPIIKVVIPLSIIGYFLYQHVATSFKIFVLHSVFCLICTIILLFVLGITKMERNYIFLKIKYLIKRNNM